MLEKLNPRFKHLLRVPSSATTVKSATGTKKKKSVAIEDPKEKAAMASLAAAGGAKYEKGNASSTVGSSIRKSALRVSTSREVQMS